jgi:hypothetical protein
MLILTRFEASTLDALKDGIPLEPLKRDDDLHCFENYGGNGTSHRSIHEWTSIHQFPFFKMSTRLYLMMMCEQ